MDTSTARALSSRLADLLSREQAAMADFLVALADFDRRRLWEPLGYSSLWHYLHRELGLSKGTAHYRQVAAGLLARFPAVEAPLRDGRLCVTSVVELARVLTAANEAEVLPRFFHRSKQEAKEVAAELCPREVVPRRVVVTAASVQPVELEMQTAPLTQAPSTSTSTSTATPTATPTPAASQLAVVPLTADLRRLHVTVSRRFLEKLEAAREALSHAKPGADAEAILEAGLDLILVQQAKRRAQVERPRKAKAPPGETTSIPAEVRRAVWARDEGRCQWRLESGDKCGSTHRPELDHIQPKGRGGPSTVANLRVLCGPHNQLAARLAYGERWMRRYRRSFDLGREEAAGAADA
jgi:5-methylcytosine-specific restriction endonuclease McrA